MCSLLPVEISGEIEKMGRSGLKSQFHSASASDLSGNTCGGGRGQGAHPPCSIAFSRCVYPNHEVLTL